MQYTQLQEKDIQNEAMTAQQVTMKTEKLKSDATNEALHKEIDEQRRNNKSDYLLERLDLVKQENITLKKSLAEYKAGYSSLTDKCHTLTDSLATTKDMLEHVKHGRRKSKSFIPAILENDTNDKPIESSSTRDTGDVQSESVSCQSPGPSYGKRRNSSRMSILRKKSMAVNALTSKSNAMTTDTPTSTTSIIASDENVVQADEINNYTFQKNQMGGSKWTENKECQVNIDSSQYANVRMGNEEEVVVKALYRRVTELEDIVHERQTTIANMLLDINDQELHPERKKNTESSHLGRDVELSEYQTQSYEDFLSLKSDEKRYRKCIAELENNIKTIQEEYLATQCPAPVMESMATQCETNFLVAEANVQAVADTKEYATQTSHHTPISNHQTIDDPFYSYIFKELLDVCKHVVASNLMAVSTSQQECRQLIEGEIQDPADTDRKASAIISGCKNLVSSLYTLRKDIFEEMKYR